MRHLVERHDKALAARRAVRDAIRARADTQHAQVLRGDPAGVYGAYRARPWSVQHEVVVGLQSAIEEHGLTCLLLPQCDDFVVVTCDVDGAHAVDRQTPRIGQAAEGQFDLGSRAGG